MSELSLRFLYLSTSLPISASVRGSMLAADGSCCLSSAALFADFYHCDTSVATCDVEKDGMKRISILNTH